MQQLHQRAVPDGGIRLIQQPVDDRFVHSGPMGLLAPMVRLALAQRQGGEKWRSDGKNVKGVC